MKNLTLTEQEANMILQALAKFPFDQVAPLIASISKQLQPVPAPIKEDDDTEAAQ